MTARFSRTERLVGEAGVRKLQEARVAVFGVGGVGGYALEALARAGVGSLLVVDCDLVDETNINRQLLAVTETIGRPKVDAALERVVAINPAVHIETLQAVIEPANVHAFASKDFTHAVEAIDTLDAKVHLILALHAAGKRFVSCMGAGAKLDPFQVRYGDIAQTQYCPLARRVRQRLRKEGVTSGVRCVYSEEKSQPPVEDAETEMDTPIRGRRTINGTISYMPGMVGLAAAGVILRDILDEA